MSNHVTLVGVVTSVVKNGSSPNNGYELLFHVQSYTKLATVWFTVQALGKKARENGDVSKGDMVSVMGTIAPTDRPLPGNVRVIATTVFIHGYDYDAGCAALAEKEGGDE